MQSYGGQSSQGYPYMYAPQQGAPNGMYGAPPGVNTYPINHQQNSRYMGSPYALPPGTIPGQPVIPTPDGRMPRPRHLTDRSRQEQPRPQLKSAMKKSRHESAPVPATPLMRSRTYPANQTSMPFPPAEEEDEIRMRKKSEKLLGRKVSAGELRRMRTTSDPQREERLRANSMSRPRSRQTDWQHYTPGHLFVQLHSTNRMTLQSVMFQSTVDDIRERVLPMWPEGVTYQTYRNELNDFSIQFSGSPWTAKGNLGLIAMRLILELFAVLARQGYACTSAIDTGLSLSSPRLVFSLTQADPMAEFFMIAFTNGRKKIKLINHPDHLGMSISSILREQFPRRVSSAGWDESDMYKIEMNGWGVDTSSDLVLATILQHTSTEGYKLECSIPLTHSGFWGLIQGRKELWIMKRLPYTPQ